MSENRPLVRGVTPSVAVVIVAVLATFVALTVINSSVAIILAIFGLLFGGDLLRELAEALDGETDPAADDEPTTDRDAEDALERLRVRYADGELSDAEFERRLAVLLETETVADVERYLEEGVATPSAQGAETEVDREFERSSGS
ncbi:SHOCT domain-containing protein [Natronorubrum texcoconense]|uniref:Short C-terminal domain-containing protein n=1 Tax=Natronorubrum texcoconense TaxID=1095776 RepID=A0A1G8YFV4_9EURY|nr:SHOCT domain-containing protein [Natronorubrum texcoconense]SDK01708.1 Short C-terminal domain-containing protein [Natronorubrum texcoconense]